MRKNDRKFDLYLAHRGELLDYASAITGDRAHGEDIVQEAFLRLRSEAASRPLDEPLGYLRRVIRNLALDWRRSRKAESRYIDSSADTSYAALDAPTTDDALSQREELRIVMAAISELPERTRIALGMHRFDQLKLREIAQSLEVSTATAHGLVHEGLAYCHYRLAGGKPRIVQVQSEKDAIPSALEETDAKSGKR